MHLSVFAFMHSCLKLANDANYVFAQMRIAFDEFHFCPNLKNKSRHHFAKYKRTKLSLLSHCASFLSPGVQGEGEVRADGKREVEDLALV